MKARQITTTQKYWETYDHVFKHYANALEFRSRIRASNLKERNPYRKTKMTRIKEIEVADDYWKKDFWKYLDIGRNFWIWKKPKTDWRQDHTEAEFLSLTLWILKQHKLIDLDYKDQDVKFMKEDITRVQQTKFPKSEETKQLRECFFSCRRTLRKMWKERFFSEKTRWMYEDEFNEYCERMDAMQKELNAFIS